MKIAAIKLSGNDKLYFYTARDEQCINVNVGDRVVVPNKVKDDGTLSLSIGTFDGFAEAGAVGTEGLKPIVQFIDATEVRTTQLALLKAEANAPKSPA